jgi:protein TonB
MAERSFLAAIVLGILTAFGLFWVMQALIGVEAELDKEGQRLSVDFVRLRRDTSPEEKKREPPRREKPDQPPPPPEMNMAENIKPGEGVGEIMAIVDTGVELAEATSLGVGGSDRDIVPLVRVDPDYPPRAQQRGIEGWVEVEFTITKVGTVKDARVLKANPPYVFDRAALQAVLRWRYNPQIKDGQPVEYAGQRTRFTFQVPKGR